MSTKIDIIDLMDNASESALEKIFEYVKKIIREEKGKKIYTLEDANCKNKLNRVKNIIPSRRN